MMKKHLILVVSLNLTWAVNSPLKSDWLIGMLIQEHVGKSRSLGNITNKTVFLCHFEGFSSIKPMYDTNKKQWYSLEERKSYCVGFQQYKQKKKSYLKFSSKQNNEFFWKEKLDTVLE